MSIFTKIRLKEIFYHNWVQEKELTQLTKRRCYAEMVSKSVFDESKQQKLFSFH